MYNIKILFFIMSLFMFSLSWGDEMVTGELIFKLYNMPQHSIQFKTQAQDNVFDENKLYTEKYQGKNLTISQSTAQINIDFCSSQDAGNVDTIGYSLYKITLDNDIIYVDYRDCNFGPYPGLNWDVTFKYYYDTGQILWKSHEGQWINFNGQVFEIWRTRPDYPVYDPDISCFRPAVIFENLYVQNPFGRLGIDSSYFVDSGDTVKFDMNSTHFVIPEYQKYLDGAGVTGKDLQHHDWNDVADDYFIREDFTVTSWLSDEEALFNELKLCTLKTELLSGGSGIKVSFKDPWFLEQDGSQPGYLYWHNSPYVPNLGYGAFLDQEPNPSNPNTPYYSLKVPNDTTITFHSDEIDWYFQKWTGTNVDFEDEDEPQTAIVFTQSGAVATAEYKGHLASNTGSATALNNGRRLLKDPRSEYPNRWYMVYEDHGQIYFSISENDGGTWTAEKWVSEVNWADYTNTQPSISYIEIGTFEEQLRVPTRLAFGITWDTEYNGSHHVAFAMRSETSSPNQATWYNDVYLGFFDHNTQPVITSTLPVDGTAGNHGLQFYILYRDDEGLGLLRLQTYPTNYLVQVESSLSGTSEYSMNPSVVGTQDPENIYLLFCWEEDGDIYYSNYDVDNFTEPEEPLWVTPYAGGTSNSKPNITYQNEDYVDIAWQHWNGETGIDFRHVRLDALDPSGETSINEVSGYFTNYTVPSIGAIEDSEYLVGTCQEGSSTIRVLSFDSEEWDLLEEDYDGQNPGVNVIGDEIRLVWTDHTDGLPYVVRQDEIEQDFAIRSRTQSKKYLRQQQFKLSDLSLDKLNGFVKLEIGDIELQNTNSKQVWPFRVISPNITGSNFQKTTPLTINNDFQSFKMDLMVKVEDYEIPATIPSNPLFQVQLMEENNPQPLATLYEFDFTDIKSSTFKLSDSVVVDLTPYRGKTVSVRLQSVFDKLGNTGARQALINIFRFMESSLKINPVLSQMQSSAEIELPNIYQLYQNYPNPFNPTTTLEFDLPKSNLVDLVIYDISGKKVKTLINSNMEAGSHQVLWDGHDDYGNQVASGMYFYRINAGSFQDIKKMVLLR